MLVRSRLAALAGASLIAAAVSAPLAANAATTITATDSTRILAPLPGGDLAADHAWGLSLSPDETTLYASEYFAGGVRAIDLTTGSGTTVATGPGAYAVATHPSGSAIYVANSADAVGTYLTTGPLVADSDFITGSEPRSIVVSPDGTRMYTAARSAGSIGFYSLAPAPTFLGDIGAPLPIGLALSPAGTRLAVAAEGDDSVRIHDVSVFPPVLTSTTTVGTGPRFLAFSPDGATVWVGSYGADTVTPITVATGVAGTPIVVGSGPADLRVSPDGRWLYVNVDAGGAYVVVDIAAGAVASSTPATLPFPYSMAMRADGSRLYSGSGGTSGIVVLDALDLTLTATAAARIDPGTPTLRVATGVADGRSPVGDYSGGTLLVELLDAGSAVVAASSGSDVPDPVTGLAAIDIATASLPEGTYSLRATWTDGDTTLVATAAGLQIAALLPPTGSDIRPQLFAGIALVLLGAALTAHRPRRREVG